ncbi:hypothetical protein D3C74_485200 [compost metagenome]
MLLLKYFATHPSPLPIPILIQFPSLTITDSLISLGSANFRRLHNDRDAREHLIELTLVLVTLNDCHQKADDDDIRHHN